MKMVGVIFANKQYQEMGKKLGEKEKVIMYKLNPEIAKIDKKIDALIKKIDLAMEKELVEINKREAQSKDNTTNKEIDQKVTNLQKQKEELMQKDKEIYEARKAALKPGTVSMTMPPHYNEIRAIDEQIKALEKQR